MSPYHRIWHIHFYLLPPLGLFKHLESLMFYVFWVLIKKGIQVYLKFCFFLCLLFTFFFQKKNVWMCIFFSLFVLKSIIFTTACLSGWFYQDAFVFQEECQGSSQTQRERCKFLHLTIWQWVMRAQVLSLSSLSAQSCPALLRKQAFHIQQLKRMSQLYRHTLQSWNLHCKYRSPFPITVDRLLRRPPFCLVWLQ